MKMNSPEDLHENGIDPAESPSGSQITDENSNASVKTPGDSKGAIPKTAFGLILEKKSIKANNNLEDVETVNGTLIANETKCNGFVNEVNSTCLLETGEDVKKNGKLELCPSKSKCSAIDVKLNSTLSSPIENDLLFSPLNEASCSSFRDSVLRSDSDSSSEDNEVLSVSDDGCIYTYKGDNDDGADLPTSFFNLALPPFEVEDTRQSNRNNASSPEMDFLEMDFDPGPSGDADSDTTSNTDIDNTACLPTPSNNTVAICTEPKPCCSRNFNDEVPVSAGNKLPNASIKMVYSKFMGRPITRSCSSQTSVTYKSVENEIKMPWSCTLLERTKSGDRLRRFKKHLTPKGEIISPIEGNVSSFNDVDLKNISQAMVWTVSEAYLKQITQVGPSSCGATAVLNVLNALRLPLPPVETVQEYVNTKLRANSAPLTEYLLSRSKAGCNHRDIMLGLYSASDGTVYSKFFAMYPERVVNLQKWLGYWINNGVIPIATLNLQKCEGAIPDSWHHQMIFGVDENGIYLTNPIERVEASQLWPQLCSESVLLVRREDIILRFSPMDFPELMKIEDERWKELNVVGQIAHIIRESRRLMKEGFTNTSHVKIPADYKAGITLVVNVNSPAFKLLHQCPELPLLQSDDVASAAALYK